jgi:alkylated DNA repair dioxygenase AlkB
MKIKMIDAPEPPVRYFAKFIPDPEARELFGCLIEAIPWEQKHIVLYGNARPVPRLTCSFGDAAYAYSGIVNNPQPWTDELSALRRLIEAETAMSYNSCLANLYRDGRDSVGWHADNEAELGAVPTIASVSLGAARVFKLKHVATAETVDYELGPGNLLVMYGACQTDWLHAIPKRVRVAGPRINLTFRKFHSPKPGPDPRPAHGGKQTVGGRIADNLESCGKAQGGTGRQGEP